MSLVPIFMPTAVRRGRELSRDEWATRHRILSTRSRPACEVFEKARVKQPPAPGRPRAERTEVHDKQEHYRSGLKSTHVLSPLIRSELEDLVFLGWNGASSVGSVLGVFRSL